MIYQLDRPWLAFQSACTQDGRAQCDGAVAISIDGDLYSLPEERISRKKHDGSVHQSLTFILKHFGLKPADVGRVFVSTCAEEVPKLGSRVPLRTDGRLSLDDLGFEPNVVEWVSSHHRSHAFEALHAARVGGYLEAPSIIIVADYIGQPGEHQTVFVFEGGALEKIWGQSGLKEYVPGFGAAYDAVTEHLGWRPNFDTGKTMALAGMVEGPTNEVPTMVEFNFGYLSFKVPAGRASRKHFFDNLVPGCGDRDNYLLAGARLANLIQTEIESAIIGMIDHFLRRVPARAVLFGGGLATNCKLLGKVSTAFPNLSIHGSLAPGDTGQGIGSLVGATFEATGSIHGLSIRRPHSGFWNKNRASTSKHNVSGFYITEAAALVSRGGMVVTCCDEIEPGPRALGMHSILACARNVKNRERINSLIKGRESFQPLGGLITDRAAEKWFGAISSPYMDIALKAPPQFAEGYPALIHSDGTVRLQTLSSITRGSFAQCVLDDLEARYGVESILNTSLNRTRSPFIVDPKEAQEFAASFGVPCMLVSHNSGGLEVDFVEPL